MMLKYLLLAFSTIVLAESSLADFPKSENDLSTLSITKDSSAPAQPEKSYFFSYNESFSTRLGLGYYALIPNDPPDSDKNLFYLFGLQYMFSSLTNKHFEIGFDVNSQSRAYLHAGFKWVYKSTEAFRPYSKIGLNQRWDRGDGMEALVDFKSYSLKLATGFEKTIYDPMSFRLDFEILIGADEITGLLGIGYSWPW